MFRVLGVYNFEEMMKKDNTWNMRRLVDDLFVPSSQCIKFEIDGFQNCNALIYNFLFQETLRSMMDVAA